MAGGTNSSANGAAAAANELIEGRLEKLDLQASSLEELQLARVVVRKPQTLALVGYSSDNDASDGDEEDGRLVTEREYHDNGVQRHFRTYQNTVSPSGKHYQRVVEDKHFDTDGVCRLDVHFAIGSPYLSRKHYYPCQTLKSESLFWVDDEVSSLQKSKRRSLFLFAMRYPMWRVYSSPLSLCPCAPEITVWWICRFTEDSSLSLALTLPLSRSLNTL
jgi:hypothetical protein